MDSDVTREIVLEALQEVRVVRVTAPYYQEKCMVCFDNQGHRSGVVLKVVFGDSNTAFRVKWSGNVTAQMKQSHADLQDAVEAAACGITFLLVQELTEWTTIRQAVKGTTVDYYLAPNSQDDSLIFNNTARLEVSGILAENESNTVEARVQKKQKRLKPDSQGDLPTFISVVEFGQPWSKMVES